MSLSSFLSRHRATARSRIVALVLLTALPFGAPRAMSADGRSTAAAPGRLAAGAGPVVDHRAVADFLRLTPREIAAAAALRVLFIDHSVGVNISDGLDCMAFPSINAAPSRCKHFEHVVPALSADPEWFPFGVQYDRSKWVYQAGGSSYWREWPAYVESLLVGKSWDLVIPMPSYLVGPNGGWQAIDDLEAAHPEITFVYATTSLPRGSPDGTAPEQVMERFNRDARAYALAKGKPFLDVADILSHDYQGQPCVDTRDGQEYCQGPGRCENLPDDGVAIPAICQHYTSELYGGHLGSVSGGNLRMAQAMWLLMARLSGAGGAPGPSPTAGAGATSTATAEPTRAPTSAPTVLASATMSPSPASTAPATPSPTPHPPETATSPVGPPTTPCFLPFAAAQTAPAAAR